MHIKTDIKLDFDDVLLCPKISGLVSRKSVNITRNFTMIHSGRIHSGIPIMASNMDGVGTFSMAMELQKHDMYTWSERDRDMQTGPRTTATFEMPVHDRSRIHAG